MAPSRTGPRTWLFSNDARRVIGTPLHARISRGARDSASVVLKFGGRWGALKIEFPNVAPGTESAGQPLPTAVFAQPHPWCRQVADCPTSLLNSSPGGSK
jgi:hypothetical protein